MGPTAYGVPWGLDIKWLDEYWQVQVELRELEGKRWSNWAVKHNVKCQFIYDRKIGDLSKRILEAAKSNQADIIATAIKRGRWSQVILGRNIRELFVHSVCPVMVIHATLKKKSITRKH